MTEMGVAKIGGARPRGCDSARVMQVIVTTAIAGRGTKDDPVRNVIQYWDFDGNLLAANDPEAQNKMAL